MPQAYQVQAPCFSSKCDGAVRTFEREVWQEEFTRSTRMGERLREVPLEMARCTECRVYSHIPVTDEEADRLTSKEYQPKPGEFRRLLESALKDIREANRKAREGEGAD